MIKLKVLFPGVFATEGEKQVEVPVGHIITLDSEEVPSWLVGKVEIVGEVPEDAVPVSNEAKPEDKKKA